MVLVCLPTYLEINFIYVARTHFFLDKVAFNFQQATSSLNQV